MITQISAPIAARIGIYFHTAANSASAPSLSGLVQLSGNVDRLVVITIAAAVYSAYQRIGMMKSTLKAMNHWYATPRESRKILLMSLRICLILTCQDLFSIGIEKVPENR